MKCKKEEKGKEVEKLLYILNSLVLPISKNEEHAVVEVRRIDVDEARKIVSEANEVISAVGHKATAEMLTRLLEYPIEVNRIFVEMAVGDDAIAIQVLQRLQEGKVLNSEEIEQLLNDNKIILRHLRRIA